MEQTGSLVVIHFGNRFKVNGVEAKRGEKWYSHSLVMNGDELEVEMESVVSIKLPRIEGTDKLRLVVYSHSRLLEKLFTLMHKRQSLSEEDVMMIIVNMRNIERKEEFNVKELPFVKSLGTRALAFKHHIYKYMLKTRDIVTKKPYYLIECFGEHGSDFAMSIVTLSGSVEKPVFTYYSSKAKIADGDIQGLFRSLKLDRSNSTRYRVTILDFDPKKFQEYARDRDRISEEEEVEEKLLETLRIMNRSFSAIAEYVKSDSITI